MPKYVPEIRVSAADYSRRERMENDSHSECAMSDVATDYETLEASYSKRSKALQGKNEDRDEEVILTDLDASSDDERETVVRYPIDCINSILDLGMSCEEVSNSQGPNKRQKSITCSLERSKPRSLNSDKFDEGGTDVEGVYMSEDEEAYTIDSDNEVQGFEPTAYVSISDKVVTGTIVSPRVTPEPCMGRKKRSSTLSAPIPISSVLTDTEMLISDTESNSTRSRKMTKAKPFKTMFDGFASDTDDSDSSAGHSSKANCRPNRKISCSRSFDNIRNTSSMKNSMLAPVIKMEDGALTDTEHIYLDDAVAKEAGKSFETRPSVIRMNKQIQSPENASTVRYRHNAVKSKPQPAPQGLIYSSKKCNEKSKKQPGFNLNVPMKDDTGNATDVEAFGSDSDDQMDTIKPVAYLPNPKCELIIDNESHKGKMSFILPITDSQKGKSLRVDDLDCGYSDVEELPGFEAEEYFRYPTPELPRTEHSMVQNKEAVIDPSKLKAEPTTKEPLTDTEELDLSHKPTSGNRLKVKLNHQRKNRDITECHTDIEDLDGSDTESRKVVYGKAMEDIDQVELTDVGELSSDDSDDDGIYRFTAVTPDLDINNTYTNARESMSPFSFDVRRRLNETIPKIRTISPTPTPRNTSTEDFLASQEESAGSNWASDDGHIETHSSQIHIKHTKKFNIDEAEKLHVKGFVNYPDPTTDVEELTIFEALEELRQKKRKLQKSKEQSEGTAVKVCYSGPKGVSCKPNTRIYKSSGRHDDKPRGADKSKEAVESSWLSQREGESVDGGMRLNAGGLRSPYDNVNGIYYKEMADESVYPPQLGYVEFESPDVIGSTSSLTQEHGTDTFSELLFSSSNSESEEPDENFPISRENETYGILYDMSTHINKVPEMFAKRTEAARVSAEAHPDSSQDLESRLKYYHDLCNRSLSPEIQEVSPAERAELRELEESISQMLIDIRREESLFYSDKTEGATNTVKRRPKSKKDIQDEKYKKINDDGETALKEIEHHISKLLQDVEKEEREVMGSLRRGFRNSSDKLEESAPSPWDMINATTNSEGNSDVSYVRFRESSCTPSPVESSSTSEDEYDVVPRVELNIGSRLGRSTIDISVKNSPALRRKSTRMSAAKRSLNRSLPSLKSSSMSPVWKDHNSTECLLESPKIWQSSSVEYISPPQRIEPGSGYCIWSYPSEDEYGQDQVTEDVKKTPIQEKKSTKEPPKDQKPKEKGKHDDVKKEPTRKNEKPSLDRKGSTKRVSPDKTPEPSKKVSPVKADKKPLERRDSKKTPSPEKSVLIVREKTSETQVKFTEESTTAPTEKVSIKSQKSHEKTDEKLVEIDRSKQKSTEKTKVESTKKETALKEKIIETKEGQIKLDDKITKQVVEPAKDLATEKKSTILGKTIETIKKPFQDKGGDKSAAKEEKGKGKGKGKGKQKSIDSIKSPSQESDEPIQEQLSNVEDEIKTIITDPIEHKTIKNNKEITSESSKVIKEPVVEKNTVENTVEIISDDVSDIGKGGQRDDKSNGKGKGKGKVPEVPKVDTLSRTTSQEQEKPIRDSKDGKTTLKDNGKGKDEGSPKETTGKGKGKEKSESPKAEPIEKGAAKGEKTVVKQTSAQIDKSSEDKKRGADKGTTKDANGKGKGKGKMEQVKQQSADRVSVVEPLIEKTVQDITVIAVGSVNNEIEDKAKKDDKPQSPKDGKNKGKGKDKSGPEKTPSLGESDKPQKTDTTVVGKAVEMIKKPLQDQTKPVEDTKATQKPGKGKKQKSIESTKGPSLDKDDAAKEQTELASQSKSEEKTVKPGNEESDKKVEKPTVKEDKTKGKGKGKQKSIESNKSPSPDKDKIVQNVAKVESSAKEQNKEQKSPEPTKSKDTKKGKGKQKSLELPKTPSLEKEEDSLQQVSTPEATLIEKTLDTIKRPFQGKKDDKPAPKQGHEAEGKKGKGKSKQKSVESVHQSSTEQDPKEQTVITTETVRLIKELSQDKSGQVIEGRAIDLVTKPFGDKPPVLKSNDSASPMDGSTRTATLIKELSQDKSGQQIEGKSIELVSKPFEHMDIKTLSSGGEITTTAVKLTKELSQGKSGQVIKEKEIDLVSQPLQEAMGTQKQSKDAPPLERESSSTSTVIKEFSLERSGQVIGEKSGLVSEPFEQKDSGALPSGKIITTTVVTLTKDLSHDESGHAIVDKKVDLVTKPFQVILDTHKGITQPEPHITELSLEKSGFIIEERPIDLVSQPFQDILETSLASAPLPSVDTTILTKTQDKERAPTTGPLIKELAREKSEFVIEEKPIDLVSQPFQDIIAPAPHSSSITGSTMVIKKLSHDKSGQNVEEKPIDLVSKPIQDTLSKILVEEGARSTGPQTKEFSQEKSGFIIEERPIDLVGQPFQDIIASAPHSSSITGSTMIIKKLSHDKSGQNIEEKPIDLVSKSLQDTLSKTLKEKAPSTGPLMKELSHEKSGFIIEERPIDLVSQPFQDIIASAPHSSSSKDEITGPTIVIKQLSHDKSGQKVEEKHLDLVSKPLLDTLSKTLVKAEVPSTGPLIKELSQEKTGFIIEERPIDLVSQPFQDIIAPAPHSSSSKDEMTGSTKIIKKLPQDKSGQKVEEKPIDLVSKPLQDTLSKTLVEKEAPSTGPLIKELSHEKSGFIIEERPIDLVSQPFQDILASAHSSSSKHEITGSTKLIKKLSHDKSGQIVEEKPTDLLSKPLQDSLSKSQGEEKKPSTGPLIKELSHEKSGFIIEERPIDLVSQPFQDIIAPAPHSSSSKDDITGSTNIIKKLPHHKSGQKVEEKPLQDTLSKTLVEKEAPSTGPLIKELSHEKSGFIIEERPIDLVSQPFQDILASAHSSSSKHEITGSTKLIKKLSHDKSGQIVEEKPTDLLSKPLQDSLSKSQGEEKKPSTGPLIKDLSHEKSGFIIEERPIDLVSQPFQGILETPKSTELRPFGKEGTTSDVMEKRSQDIGQLGKVSDNGSISFEGTRELPPSSLEGPTRAVSLMKELSQDKSGQVIEEGAIDLVAQPFLGSLGWKEDGAKLKKKESKSKTGDSKKGDESATKKNDFEHIQKTIDDAKIQFDQFVGIVSDKSTKSSSDSDTTHFPTNEKESNSDTTITTTTITPFDTEGGETLKSDEQEVEIPVEKEEDLLRIQKTIQHGFLNIPSGKIGTIDVKTVTTTITKPIEQGAGHVSIQAKKVMDAIDKDVEKVTETISKSVDGRVTIIEKTVESQVKPVKDGSAALVEKNVVTVQENLPKIDDSFLNFGKTAHEFRTQTDKQKDLPKVLEIIQQELQDLPSENIGTVNIKTVIKTVTKPIEQGAEYISIQAEKVVEAIDKDEKKVKETVKRSVEGGDTVIEKTIELQVKPVKDASETLVEKTTVTVQEPLDDAFKSLGKMAHQTVETIGKSQILTKGEVRDIGQEAVGKVTHSLKTQESEHQSDFESSESFPPEFRAQSVKMATFETVETIPPPGTAKDGKTTILSEVTVTSSSSDEIGRIIKEMESQLLSTKFGLDDSTVDDGSEVESEDYTRESRTMPTTPMPVRKMFGDTEAISDSEGVSKPYVTTPTLSRRVIGVGGSQRLTQDERPVVRVITEYVGDLSESEPEEDSYTVLEPEVKERRKFKIRFSPDMYGSDDKEDVEEVQRPDTETEATSEALKRSDSIKSEKNIKRIERKFERMTSQTKEADPSMSEVTDGEFQRMVSQLSLEEMDQALHQWDAGGLTPSEVDSKDLTLSSDDTTSPLQQGLTEIFRPKLSSILPTSIYMEKTGTEVGSSGLTESSKMKLSLVKDSVPQIFQSVETDGQVREGSHTLEPGETGETPPIPSPRTPLKPTDSQDRTQDQTPTQDKDDDESKNYATRKMFWEQMSSGSVETPPSIQDVTPPVPKPRIRSSISQSIDLSEEKKAVSHSEASIDQEVSEIGESDKRLHGVTTTESVARDSTTERGISLDADTNSEMEFIKSHDIEELSYDNDAFDDDTTKDFPFPEPKQRKGIYERSVSLPGDTTIDISNNVRSKKRIFEAQIKKEMVVEQLMSQMEEEGSPEHKAFEMTTEPTDQAAMLNRQIHSEIVSHELEEQIESNILENKALIQNKTEIEIQNELKQKATKEVSPVKTEDDASESDKTNDTSSELPSIYETKISSTVTEVLHYKHDAISKPSDSLEVHVDKSELEDTEKVKEIEEELRIIDEKYESRQLASSDQAKVSSITSSQGESEDTFSESDVTPEDVRFKEQHDIHVWGPSDKDIKLAVDKLDEQKKTRSVHTPEEHIPDTVWEVPVQESTESLEVETVGQLPTAVASWQESEALTESEARKIAEIFVGEIESELINTEAMALDSLSNEKDSTKIKTPEKTPTTKKSDNMLKLIRTDTATSSMEITDEDLRSSGWTDNSPLESQAGLGPHMSGQHDVFGEDSGDDVDAQELDRDTIGKEDVEKTLAEVKQSLEAVKEELIEEKKKKRDSITKESPSEFEFKALVLEKTFSESIQEHHQEEATTNESKSLIKTREESFSSRTEKSEVSKVEKTYSSFEQTSMYGSETKTTAQKLTSETTAKYQGPISHPRYDEISKKEEIKFEEHETRTIDTTTLYATSTDDDIQKDQIVEPKEIKTPGSTTGSEVSIKSAKSQDTVIERESIEKQGPSTMPSGEIERTEKVMVLEKEETKDESTSQSKTLTGIRETSSRPDLDSVCDPPVELEERKSPLDDVFSNSSSSDYKGGSNEASTLDKPNIIIRKHRKSTLGTKDQKSDGELYSSSGSHYESFEQTSESIKSPGSRPLSSDVEGLVAASAGMTTGSSEYESAVSHEISGQSTTITSREYQTAVSSLSSRDSMKSLDSESSGNLASIEVSSEASETLVPSAMELEKDNEEPVIKQQNIPLFTAESQVKMQSFSESIEHSVSFDISGEDISEDDYENQVQPDQEQAIRMKRSHEMTFQPEPRPIVLEGELSQGQDEKLVSSIDDMSSLVSSATDTGANRTVIELSKTESERMDGSATSEQLSLTVSGTSDLMSLSESREFEETTVLSRTETIATQSPPFQQSAGGVESVTIITSSVLEQGIQSVCTQVTSKVEMRDVSHSNGPTQVEYNAEYDEGEHEVKKRGHRRNESTSFRPSMIPVFQARDTKKKSEEIIEDSAESDKYTQPLTVKEGTQEEKKDVDETEKLEEEFYKTEADQAMNRDLREGRISIGDTSYGEGSKSFDSSLGSKSRLHSAAFSEDHPDSEIAELLKQCSSDIPSEDPIERPKTPEPVEECELKDDTPEFSSEAQASVTELEMEYSGAFSRSAEYAAHVSPIREKGLPTHESWELLSEGEQTMDDSMLHSPDPLHLGFEDSASEKHELETHESTSKEKPLDRSKYVSSPVPDITVTQHMHPSPQDSFENIEMDSANTSGTSKQTKVEGVTSDVTDSSEKASASKGISDDLEDKKGNDSTSDSPTSDSFELLEKPDIADEFVIIEEVGREASEQDTEGKSVTIDMKRVTPRVGSSFAPTVVSPPTTVTKMTQVKYFSSGATEEEIPFDFDSGSPAKSAKSEKESSQEGSPPSAEEPDFKPDLEASKKWMEMQFQGAEPIAQIYGYDVEYDRGPLEDIKEEDINDLEGSSRIGSMGSQVSQSIGSYGSVKESLSSTPDYDVLAGRKFFTRSGEHDDVSMSSLQEFERLEHLIAMESSKHKSLGSQDSLTSSSNNSRKHGSRSGGDDVSLASLKEFEGLESACIAAESIEKKAKAEEESLLSEIEEGHESQASESESCATISIAGIQRGESDEDDYERRMFEIDEIIRQAQTNVEQFMDSKNRETVEGGLKSETLGRADSLEEISKVPELDLDQPLYSVSYSSGKSYIQQWEDLGDDLLTSTDSLELKTQKSKTSVADPFTTSTDSLDVKISQDVMSVSTDSIEASQKAKKKDIMTDSIEVGEKTSMLTSVDSLEGKVTQANSIDEDEHHAMGTYDQSSSSGKEGDLSSSGKDDSAEGAVGMNRMPPPRAEYLLGSTDSLEPTSSTATHATYQYETDSVMSSSFTSGDSTTMVDDNDEEGAARASMWFDEGKPYVTEVIEPIIGDEQFSHVIHRKVEMPPEIHKVSFKGMEAEHALREYIEKFDPGEDCTETREVDEHGNVHVKRVIQKRVIVRPEELGGDTTDLSGPDLEKYLQTLTQSQMETEPLIDTIHSSSESHSTVTTTLRTTTTLSQGDSIKTEQEQKQTMEIHRRGSRPPLKYDISVDEEPEFDPREHDWRFNLHTHLERDEESQEGAYGFTESKTKGAKK